MAIEPPGAGDLRGHLDEQGRPDPRGLMGIWDHDTKVKEKKVTKEKGDKGEKGDK